MRPSGDIGKYLAAFIVALVCMVGCKKSDFEGENIIPLKGEVTYNVTYSEDLRQISTIGTFLPRSLKGIYDTCNVKLSARAPLGLANIDIVLSAKENYATVDFDKAKLLIKLGDIIPGDMTSDMAEMTKIEFSPNVTNISGYMSNCVVLEPEIASDIDERIEIFYVPFPNSASQAEVKSTAVSTQNLNCLGLVTAINITYDESNMMMMLKEVKPNDKVSAKDFERPAGFIEASRQDILAMIDLIMN